MAAVLCVDESQIKLNENTIMFFKEAAASPRFMRAAFLPRSEAGKASRYQVPQGEVWLRNANETFRFKMETPAVTAAIRGTEFSLSVDKDGFSSLTLLHGSVVLSNPYGELRLFPGELGTARPGQAPIKQILVSPEDAVQWTLYYPGIVSFRDLPLNALPGPPLSVAELAYDKGDMDAARAAAAADLAVDPANAQALALLGWVALRENAPSKALGYFEQSLAAVSSVQARQILGLALSRFRLGEAVQANALFQDSLPDLPNSPDLWAMAGFFAVMAGQPEQAEAMIGRGLQAAPGNVLCQSLLAQMRIAQNRKLDARQESRTGLAAHPQSPLANLTEALVDITFFELESAQKNLQAALMLDKDFLTASIYLARLYLGADRLDQAWQTILPALEKAPEEAEVLSMAGFIRLGFRDYEQARELFERAADIDPGLGDPRMGLSQYWFAKGDDDRGLMQALTATLLDPRVALHQSFLGKALFQTRSFDKALETFDYAKALDPADPTPHLYKGIVLTDLNRPGEAVQEFNRSIALNDNRAVFRSRLMLDRDLAVRNYDLARAFSQMGLNEWAKSKARTAVQHDPLNPSAHLFLFLAGLAQPIHERSGALASEYLLYRLLSRANQNTFTFTNDYTPMFEAPYVRMQVRSELGAWSNANNTYNYALYGLGGLPGLAGWASISRERDQGFRDVNSLEGNIIFQSMAKWEPTVDHSFLAHYSWYDKKAGDTFYLDDYTYIPSPNLEQKTRNTQTELGYVYRFSPSSTFLAYAKHYLYDETQTDHEQSETSLPNVREFLDTRQKARQENYNIQLQQRFHAGDHTIMFGLDYLEGTEKLSWEERYAYQYFQTLVFDELYRENFSFPVTNFSAYLADYWSTRPDLIMEFSLSYDQVKRDMINSNKNLVSTRMGLNWETTRNDTVRLAVQRYLATHGLDAQLQPPEIAGFPGQRNAVDTSTILEAGAGWERQWNERTFSVLRTTILQSKEPQFHRQKVDRYQGELVVNRILSPVLGLSLSGLVKKVLPDEHVALSSPEMDFQETRGTGTLSFRHQTGLAFQLIGILVSQRYRDERALDQQGKKRENSSFSLLNAKISYEFPDKRGSIALEVNNILRTQFSYQPDFVSWGSFYTDRLILLSLGVNF